MEKERERVWKRLDKYCLLSTKTNILGNKGRIIEICCIKVVDNQIIDKFHTLINPNYYKCSKKLQEYEDYSEFPTIQDIVPTLLEFAKGFYFVGWCIDYDFYHLEKEGKFIYRKNVVDVFESYYRSYKHFMCPCSLENVYHSIFDKKKDYVEYDYDSPTDRCLALKQVYDHKKDVNMFIYKELPNADYLEFPDGDILWLKGEKRGKYEKKTW